MDFQELYDAMVRSDPAYEGRFITGVRTTGIFCRPTCRARKPKAENVEFFPSTQQALVAGYRPCKLCHPLQTQEPVPGMIQALLDEVQEAPGRIPDRELRARGLDPDAVRRWFKRHHGLTFQSYQRVRRLGEAFGRIRQGETVTASALESGFDSLSAFGDSFKKTFGAAPTKTSTTRLIQTGRVQTPLGPMVAAEVDDTLCLLEFADNRTWEAELAVLERQLGARALPGGSALFDRLSVQLDEYFARIRQRFDLPLTMLGTEFQRAAWKSLGEIPYGERKTYAEQAVALGRPAAVRAVGSAHGANRIAIVVPCHRVVARDGLGGYRGGLWRKQWLLDLEAGRLAGGTA